ncbi:MAG: nitroreductase family protein [Candidatus Binatia bacterium]
MEVLEAIRTCRAMRHFRPDPVSPDLLRRLLEAATCAPSPGNSQGWDFVVVTEEGRRRELAAILRDGVRPLLPPVPKSGDASRRRLLASAHHLLDHALEVPSWILVCGRPVYPASAPSADWIGAAVYPAAQNLLLAARGLGLGATFTTWHMPSEPAVRTLLGLPDDARIAVTIPVGWPDRPFGPVRRRPLAEVVHWERW